LSSIFSIIDAGISKNGDGDGIGGDGPDWSAFDNMEKITKSLYKAFYCSTPNKPQSTNLILIVRQVMVQGL
jgi:hypothetical protein